jgi:GntR family transcriptional regulator/MocR family aminotransferase
MRLHYSRMHGIILECIRSHKLSRHCEVIENDSGLHFILKINTSIEDDVLRKMLLEKGVNIHALSEYYAESSANDLHRFLINYSNLSAEKMNTALDIIYSCVTGEVENKA